MNRVIQTTILVLGTLGLLRLQAEVPEMIQYQGYVTVSGTPFSGSGQFKFALVDKPGTTTYWSHDGTGAGGAAPNTFLTLPVNNGLYSVLLGDTSIAGMTQTVPPSVFADHKDVFLRTWFNDGTTGFQQLAPDIRIASVGFAMVAAKVCDAAITGPELAPALSLGSGGTAGALTLLETDGDKGVEVQGDFFGSGRIALKNKAGANGLALRGEGDQPGSELNFYNTAGTETMRLFAAASGTEGAKIQLSNDSGSITAQLRAEDGDGHGATLKLSNGAGKNTIVLDTQETADATSASLLQLKRNDGKETVTLRSTFGGDDGGAIQLSNSSGNVTVEVAGDAGENQGRILLKHSDLANRVRIDADGPNDSGELKLYDSDGTETIQLLGGQASTKGAAINLHDSDGTTTITLDADDEWEGGRLELTRGGGARTVRLMADLEGDGKGALQLFKGDGVTETVRITGSYLGTGGGFAHFKDKSGNITIQLNGDDNGEGKITTQVLQITGGADLSEQFDIAARANPVEPGMIVCIDPDHPGQLRVSDRPYDPAVAGVISGAGGVKPGMLMGQHGSRADGRHPVALTGRVYCYVDADQGSVQPGDLITTSPTPGHGMKVADSAKAQGAIIGKAMTPLKAGKGLVLVLVSLQ